MKNTLAALGPFVTEVSVRNRGAALSNVFSVTVQNRADAVVVSPLYVVLSVDESRLRPDYLDAFLHSPEALAQIRGLTSGSVRDTLAFRAFVRLRLHIPSLAEQDVVLDRLARVRSLRAFRERQISRLDELAKSLFVEMFGDGAYPMKRLADLADVSGGLTKNAQRNKCPLFRPYLRVANVLFNELNLLDAA